VRDLVQNMTYNILKKIDYHIKEKKRLKKLYHEIVEGEWEEKEKYIDELNYIREKGAVQVFPYTFSEQYRCRMDLVGKDENGVFVKLEDKKKLYFCTKDVVCAERFASRKYNALCREQDPHSPHRYYVEGFYPSSDDIFIDIGSAEGTEALLVADIVKKIYLFEADRNWEEALHKSFADYAEKTQILSYYVGRQNDEAGKMRRLDTCFGAECTGEKYFLKMDVEGAEKDVLLGGENFLRNNKVKLLCTTYHRPEDAVDLKKLLEGWGFRCSYSEGYMLWHYDPNGLKPPYFRKGIIRATNY
jgi:hypothetical protein